MPQNLIYLAFQTIISITPDDWFDDPITEDLANVKNSEEIKTEMADLRQNVLDYDEVAENAIQNATKILVKIYDNVHSDRETVQLVATNLNVFEDNNNFMRAVEIAENVEIGLKQFTNPIDEAMDQFNKIMSNGKLQEIIDDIRFITSECTKENASEISPKIISLNNLLQEEVQEIPKRFETAKVALENYIADHIKPIIDSNNPDNQSCAEENYLRTELYTPFKKIITSSEH